MFMGSEEAGMTNAIFWIATESHIHEAKQSAQSVARQMPDVDRILFTDSSIESDLFTGYCFLPTQKPHSLWYLNFVSFMNDAIRLLDKYTKLLYLDTDTYMVHPVPEIFDLLDYFDIASTHAPARQISPTLTDVPNAKVRDLFAEWLNTYRQNPSLYGENDQAPLRECLLNWNGRSYVMPPEYNCRFGFGGQAAGLIKILHGRSDNMSALAERINADKGIRGWRRGDFS
jgi:hypothetical protein